MRGTKAKRIRNNIFGEGSKRNPRKYAVHKKTGQLVCVGKRAIYQEAKKNANL